MTLAFPRPFGIILAAASMAFLAFGGVWVCRRSADMPEPSAPVPPPPEDPAVSRLRARCADAGLSWPPPGTSRLRIRKRGRTLTLRVGDSDVATYPVGLGSSPDGPKRAEGDGKTPEGDYSVCTRNAQSKYHRFLGLSYPNREDAREALAARRISQALGDRILDALRRGTRPPWDTPLGGEVGIHGNPQSLPGDWTAGCVAVSGEAIEELWVLCPLGTPVTIDP